MRRVLRFLISVLAACWLVGLNAADQAVLLARDWDVHRDPGGYWVSEKLDGVRALWDGTTLRTRAGELIGAPGWFVAGLPSVPLDGELWLGRGRFEALSATVRRQTARDDEWLAVRYMVFELPGGEGDFTARLARLEAIVVHADVAWLSPVKQFKVADARELGRRLHEVVAAGGEGLMLHRADSPYLTGRADALYKLKPVDDAEARVIAHLPGKGRYRGLTGALLVEMPNGHRFRIGSGLTETLRRDPPPVGSLVTYRYRGFTSRGTPRFATFWRVRELPRGL